MHLKLLNDSLNKELKKVFFVFPPIVLPISSDGFIVQEAEAEDKHYATVVYNESDKEFSVLEFDNQMKHALSAYNARHDEKLFTIRFLMSRNEDNSIRITIGNVDEESAEFIISESSQCRLFHQKLYTQYLKKQNYKVHDRRLE